MSYLLKKSTVQYFMVTKLKVFVISSLLQLAAKYGSQGNVLNDIQEAMNSAEDELPGISDRIVQKIVERTTRLVAVGFCHQVFH